MSEWHVIGARPLRGSVRMQGSKNAVLPVIAASLLTPNETVLTNCPALSDVDAAVDILRYLGCTAEQREGEVHINTAAPERWDIPSELTHRMRSSVIFLGPMLARFGRARVSLPGGCELGARPIDLHLRALRCLGAEIEELSDGVLCRARELRGTEIRLGLPSVGATENAMIAACAARGETVIYNAAREPEIETLQGYLRLLGADISGAGSPVIRVKGFSPRDHAVLTVPPDRIVTATYLCCAVCAGGELELRGVRPRELRPVLSVLRCMGCDLTEGESSLRLRAPERPRPAGAVITRPYPGFPTDAAPLLMAACLRAGGSSVFMENIFDCRFRHAEEMRRLGADISLRGPVAVVNGVERLRGARLRSPDLRGGAALVAAALGAEGETIIEDPGHIPRGYQALEESLRALGAEVWRI